MSKTNVPPLALAEKPDSKRKKFRKARIIKFAVSLAVFAITFSIGFFVLADDPGVSLTLNGVQSPSGTADSLKILFMLTVISLLPTILIMMTSFTRIIIVLSFLRNALGLQQSPPNQVLIGIALAISLIIMAPAINDINHNAWQPLSENKISAQQAYTNAMQPLRKFMFKNTENTSMKPVMEMSGIKKVTSLDQIPTRVVVLAFVLSELKKAFIMGFIIYLPFVVIDFIVSTTLMSMGMMMLPPTMISLPLKLALFVMVDGWTLTITSLVRSFN